MRTNNFLKEIFVREKLPVIQKISLKILMRSENKQFGFIRTN